MAKQSQQTRDALLQKDVENIIADLKDYKATGDERDKNYFIVFVEQKEWEPHKRLLYGLVAFNVSQVLIALGVLLRR